MTVVDSDKSPAQSGNLQFIKEVAKYFMDFLESDFHRHRNPRRSIKFRNNDNLLIGLNLAKYPTFDKRVASLIAKGFGGDVPTRIEKGTYKTNLPKNLLDLIALQIEKLTKKRVDALAVEIADEIEKTGTLYAKEYDAALTTIAENIVRILHEGIVRTFVESIEKPLQNLALGDEDNVFLIQDELVSVLLRLADAKIVETLNRFIAKEKVDIAKEMKSVFNLDDVKHELSSYFENLQIADLFSELFEMDRNRGILDKQEFYLYFGDISFNNTKYPIFYIPFNATRDGDALVIEFDSQVYINKKALEYIVQEYHAQKGTKGSLQTISERIIYLAQEPNLPKMLNDILAEITHFFELDGAVHLGGEAETARSAVVRVSNGTYICLFDKSDEALVNDYEEILQLVGQEDAALAGMFNQLINDFIHENPKPFNPDVEGEWQDLETPDKLVYPSPVPLNSEQRQILSAVRKDECKYITVEGPPGTGKSHTITAIVFDAIRNNQSVLVLSDKKEALDVVEDKITQTMNTVRFGQHFQNPILRLGKAGSNYGPIFAQATIQSIKAHYFAVRKDHEAVESGIGRLANSLKEDVEAETISYGEIDLREIREFFELEEYFRGKELVFDMAEVSANEEAATELGDLRDALARIRDVLGSPEIDKVAGLLGGDDQASEQMFETLSTFLHFLALAMETAEKAKELFPKEAALLSQFSDFSLTDFETLEQFIQQYEDAKMPVFGYLFNKKKLDELDIRFKQSFTHGHIQEPHAHLSELKGVAELHKFIKKVGTDAAKNRTKALMPLVHRILTNEKIATLAVEVSSLGTNLDTARNITLNYPSTATRVGIDVETVGTLFDNALSALPQMEFDKQIRYLALKQKIDRDFDGIPELNYAARMKQMEELVTTQVTHLMDGRLINFYENNRADAETLRRIIKNKQRFPKESFAKLKEAFPCILAGIRDYAEYIPLEPGVFDLVIIDEASQVSIAQAFPALLRAKKVLILGDKKQFSNIKAAQARSDTNREYLNGLEGSFKRNVSDEVAKLVRLKQFDIKTSILEFFAFISNYNTQLRKHFRGYKEIISYSNKYFYDGNLQVMKIRGKAIDEVLKFTPVKATEKDEVYPNSNVKEAEFIISELKRLKDEDSEASVGIITPHTNQQRLLSEMINKLPERDHFLDKFRLKIMTFDTCQGEERDIIYYSMVASPHSDKLWGIFIKRLEDANKEDEGQIKAQRLNVGFSRAKECMHFVLSKPLEDFNGSIGEALRHYQYVLDEAHKEKAVAETDSRSQMEPEVLNWFYQTKFWADHKDDIEFLPQFEIGKYLKQLHPTYQHPAYKLDFLLIYTDERQKAHQIIIEYDGFREHFRDVDGVNQYNHEEYLSDGDVYRQKVLESYGYKFLRINRFNVGDDPIATLDNRIARLVRPLELANPLLDNIHETAVGLQNGNMKQCPKCKEVKDLAEFKDMSLVTGYGRFCMGCKGQRAQVERPAPVLTDKDCPRCGAKMILRNGRRGRFYGCSRYPYCKGTRNL
ncbi:MAG TPA: AAA domain-containing protein [Candidatus Paceibacterota bacterium]